MGYTKEELERPLIGVVSAHSEIVPGHMHLDKIAEAVKAGVRMAGGTPIMVPAIGVCDGIAMGHVGMKYSLPSRELIADSVETLALAHQFDGLVLVLTVTGSRSSGNAQAYVGQDFAVLIWEDVPGFLVEVTPAITEEIGTFT